METTPTISSFVIRFVYEGPPHAGDDPDGETAAPQVLQPPASGTPYRGSIRHVQSDQEVVFTRWAEVVDFVQRFVPGILDENPNLPSPKPKNFGVDEFTP